MIPFESVNLITKYNQHKYRWNYVLCSNLSRKLIPFHAHVRQLCHDKLDSPMCGLSALHDVDNFVLHLIIYNFRNINSFLILRSYSKSVPTKNNTKQFCFELQSNLTFYLALCRGTFAIPCCYPVSNFHFTQSNYADGVTGVQWGR